MVTLMAFIASYVLGITVSQETVCYLVSLTYDGQMLWALDSEKSVECTQIVFGGHSSLELLPEKLLMFESPQMILATKQNLKQVLNGKRKHAFINSKSRRRHMLATRQEKSSSSTTFFKISNTTPSLPGLEILMVSLETPELVITEHNPSYCVTVNISVETNFSGANIFGTFVWKLVAFFDIQKDCRSNLFPATRRQRWQTMNMSLSPGESRFSLTNILFSNMNLSMVNCSYVPLYLCIEFNKHPEENLPFNLKFSPDERKKFASVNATCQERILTQCSTNQLSACCCESCRHTPVRVNDKNPNQCYCKTGSGEKCLWLPEDCHKLYEGGIRQSGVYTIRSTFTPGLTFNVYCHMSKSTGWTVFQRNKESSIEYNRSWTEFKDGFGYLRNSFWLGNEKLCYLTQQRQHSLRVWYRKKNMQGHNIFYDNFAIACADNNYTVLSLSLKSGSQPGALNGMSAYVGKQFNTCDRRNDCECGWWCCPDCSNVTNLNSGYSGKREWSGLGVPYIISMSLKPSEN